MWVFRWLISKTLRKSVDSYKQVNKLLQEQRDLLKPTEQEKIGEVLGRLREAIETPMPREELQDITDRGLERAGKVLKPYPDSWMRDTLEMFLVVFVSVIAFRAFFLQPFKTCLCSTFHQVYGRNWLMLDGKSICLTYLIC